MSFEPDSAGKANDTNGVLDRNVPIYFITLPMQAYSYGAENMPTIDVIREMYNASGVHPTTDPDDPRSHCFVDRYKKHLCKLITPGMRVLDLGCNAGRLTFAMEDMGAIATGVDFAEIPILHAKKVAYRRKSQCQFIIGDIVSLPYKGNTFDLAVLPQNIGYLSYQSLELLSVQLKEILSENGIFVVIMQDELVKRAGKENLQDCYNVQAGQMRANTTIPNKGVYASPWHCWTVAFAKYIVEKHLHLQKLEQIGEYKFLLVFRNKQGNGSL